MVTISDKRFGELVANSVLLNTYQNIANSQYDVIQRQDELSKASIAEIERLREKLEVVKSEFRNAVENGEYWMKANDTANKNLNTALNEVKYWKETYAIAFNRAMKLELKLKDAQAKLDEIKDALK